MVAASPAYDELDRRFPERLLRARALADYTSFRIGGPADRLAEVDDPVLFAELLGAARELGLPYLVLGGGSNLLVDEAGIRGLVIVNRMGGRHYEGLTVRVESGFGFDALINESVDRGLAGLEFAAGIPGSVGGAVWGNAGCYGQSIGDFMREARWIEPSGRTRTVDPGPFEFRYRESELKRNGCVLLEVSLELEPGDRERSENIIRENIALRHRKHPRGEPCAGSYFKNVPPPDPEQRRIPAGKLLDEVGAKLLSVGGAAVFTKHANIIVNRGNATASDVLQLAEMMKRRVRDRFGIELEEEVTYIPSDLTAAIG